MNSTQFERISNFQKSLSINNNKSPINNIPQGIKISVIIYCSEYKYLQNTLASVENQSFFNYEIILIYDNDDTSNLNLIQQLISPYKNINLINNKKKKGILFSYSNGILKSNVEYILLLKPGETFAHQNILSTLYNEGLTGGFDILEFNLLINNNDNITNSSLFLYKCTHFESMEMINKFLYNKDYLKIDHQKEILTNKLIKSSFYKGIVNKYKLLEYNEVLFDYYDDLFLFLFSKEGGKQKRIEEYSIIKYNYYEQLVNNRNKDNNQKINDGIFYINFLLEKTSDSFEDKKFELNEFYNLLGLIFNKFNKKNKRAENLLKAFINCKYFTDSDKNILKF